MFVQQYTVLYSALCKPNWIYLYVRSCSVLLLYSVLYCTVHCAVQYTVLCSGKSEFFERSQSQLYFAPATAFVKKIIGFVFTSSRPQHKKTFGYANLFLMWMSKGMVWQYCIKDVSKGMVWQYCIKDVWGSSTRGFSKFGSLTGEKNVKHNEFNKKLNCIFCNYTMKTKNRGN